MPIYAYIDTPPPPPPHPPHPMPPQHGVGGVGWGGVGWGGVGWDYSHPSETGWINNTWSGENYPHRILLC